MGKVIDHIPAETLRVLKSYSWPGNIRELQNMIERAVVLSRGPVLTADLAELGADKVAKCRQHHSGSLDDVLHEAERAEILCALDVAGGIVSGPHGAAARLKMKRSTLVSRMQKLGIAASRSFTGSYPAEGEWIAAYGA
jgi:formate hydrogenlyase transcriptional activator